MLTLKNFLLILILINGLYLSAQQKTIYTWFDNEIGYENSGLYNGVEFINIYNPKNGKHRFFKTDSFEIGSVKYNHQIYYKIPLKYDLHEDQLIVKIETQTGTNQILLLKEKVERFKIGNSTFEKIRNEIDAKEIASGFFELLTENEHIKLYKKSHKKLNSDIQYNSVYYEFIEVNPEYFILTDNNLFQIEKKRDLISMYKEHKKELAKFKWTSKSYKENDIQLISAINKLGQILDK